MNSKRFFTFRITPKSTILSLVALLVLIAVPGWIWLTYDLPDIHSLESNLAAPSVRFTDSDNRLLFEFLPAETGRHSVLPIDSIPLKLRQATIATEDRDFYENPGVDWRGILRSAWMNLTGGETLAGGSTVTQQLARNLLLDVSERGERSIRRKLREIILAWQLTQNLSKDEILSLYLNNTYYGALAYGVEAAAQTYFGKPANELTLAECALIAGIPQWPAHYDPFTNPENAKQRQETVLELMRKQGYITGEEQTLAARQPLVYSAQPFPAEALHFVLMAKAEMDTHLEPDAIRNSGGLTVRTTLKLDWQHQAEAAIHRQLQLLQQAPDGIDHNLHSLALVALDPHTGAIEALVGSPDYSDPTYSGAINMANTPRQPGSAIKPFVYALALDPRRSDAWTPATMILDVRTAFVTHDGKSYIPQNYDGLEHGPVMVRQALASSLNIPAVLTLQHVGLKSLFDLLGKLGVSTLDDPDKYDLSLALGGGEVSLVELTAGYAAFANSGFHVTPYTIQDIRDSQGNLVYQHTPPSEERILDQRLTWLISDMLSDDAARVLGFGANSLMKLDRPAAVKTGTTTNFRDNWTVGYTPGLVTGVWAGNPNGDAMREVTGLSGAAPVWHQFMRSVLSDTPEQAFTRPPGIVQREVCAPSGLLPTEDCPTKIMEWFIQGTEPTSPDTIYHHIVTDRRTGLLATPATPASETIERLALDLPPSARNWAKTEGVLLYQDVLENSSKAGGDSSDLLLVSPAPQSIYRLLSSVPADVQQLSIEATWQVSFQSVSLWIDDQEIHACTRLPCAAWWQLTPGTHQAKATGVLENGARLESGVHTFEVRKEGETPGSQP